MMYSILGNHWACLVLTLFTYFICEMKVKVFYTKSCFYFSTHGGILVGEVLFQFLMLDVTMALHVQKYHLYIKYHLLIKETEGSILHLHFKP